MRTVADLEKLYTLLEGQADAYLADSAPSTPGAATAPWPADLVEPPSRTRRAHRSRVAPLLAAAAVVVSVSVGLALHNLGTTDNAPGSGNATPACRTPLPTAWRTALHARQLTVDGKWLSADSITSDGLVVAHWYAADGSLHLGTSSDGARIKDLFRLPVAANRFVTRIAADAKTAVIALAPNRPKDSPSSPVDELRLVDLATGRSENILPEAPMPVGDVVGPGGWAVIQDGVVYWLAGPDYDNAPQMLMSYDIAHRTYAARPTGEADVYWNPLGISWRDGSVPVHGLPPVLPATGEHHMTVAYDGSAVAWSLYDDPSTVYWSDSSGVTRAVSQHLMSQVLVEAVAGPYVLLTYGEGDVKDQVNGDVQVLDTRTGALADTGLNAYEANRSRNGTVTFSPNDAAGSPLLVLDTGGLPPLTCT